MMNAGFTQLLMGVLAVLLIVAAVGDLRTRTIANGLNLAIAVMAPLYWWAAGVPFYPDAVERLCGAYLVFVLFFAMFSLGGMGGGDVKLATAVAMWLTPLTTLAFVVITSIAGGFVTVATLIHHKRAGREGRPETPYGVAIAFGGLWILAQRFLNHFA